MLGACDFCSCYCDLREETRKWLDKYDEGMEDYHAVPGALRLLRKWAEG